MRPFFKGFIPCHRKIPSASVYPQVGSTVTHPLEAASDAVPLIACRCTNTLMPCLAMTFGYHLPTRLLRFMTLIVQPLFLYPFWFFVSTTVHIVDHDAGPSFSAPYASVHHTPCRWVHVFPESPNHNRDESLRPPFTSTHIHPSIEVVQLRSRYVQS